jgi:hypothetical protein
MTVQQPALSGTVLLRNGRAIIELPPTTPVRNDRVE